jgi:glycosyltransferase involved in cell wall biosynthesis
VRSGDGKICWPPVSTAAAQRRIAVVVASYNTRAHIAHLVFSLHRILGADQFGDLVVVDNGSTDGSLDLLRAMRDAGLLHLIENASQRYHGPAISRGVDWLARREHDAAGSGGRVDYVWVLDSDVIVLRRDTVQASRAMLAAAGMAAIGQSSYDRWQHRVMLQMCSFMFDPAVLWQPGIPAFEEHGDPCLNMQRVAETRSLRLTGFPYVQDEHILHLGCQTLAHVARAGEDENRYYDWAVANDRAHFENHWKGPALYRAFAERFAAETAGSYSAASVVAACQRSGLLEVPR